MLGAEIPALTNPQGSFKSFVMPNVELKPLENYWPRKRKNLDATGVLQPWYHSDIKDVALPYVYHIFQDMVSKGGLK